MEKTRVYNPRKYDIGLLLQNGSERVIHAGSFALLSRDDIEYLISIAPALFENEKQLRIEDRALAVQLGVIDSEQAELLDAETIQKKLGLRIGQLKAWLDNSGDGQCGGKQPPNRCASGGERCGHPCAGKFLAIF